MQKKKMRKKTGAHADFYKFVIFKLDEFI